MREYTYNADQEKKRYLYNRERAGAEDEWTGV